MKLPKLSLVIATVGKAIAKLFLLVLKVLAAIFMLGFPFALVRLATEQHWLVGFPVVLFMGFGVYLGIRDYQAGRVNTWQGIVALGSILSILVSAFTFLSLVLNKFGAAHYYGFRPNLANNADYVHGTFFELYTWELFEIIPGVKVNEAFGFKIPLERSGFWAGLLVLTFRVLIVFIVLDVFRKWWAARNRSTVAPPKSSGRARTHRGSYGRHALLQARKRRRLTRASAS